MRQGKKYFEKFYRSASGRTNFSVLCLVSGVLCLFASSCSKVVDIEIPETAKQIVVEGSIENDVPPIVILTSSQKFFDNLELDNLGSYFVHGADMRVTGSDNSTTVLTEFCLQNLNLPDDQKQLILGAFGFTYVDSTQIPNICVYSVPDIANYFLTGTCSYVGKVNTVYSLDIKAPSLVSGNDSIHVTASTFIPVPVGLDSITIREHPNPDYRDSMVAIYSNLTVPDTFGNFLRYWTKRNSESFYTPIGNGSVYDDKLWVGLKVSLPVERGQPPHNDFDINTDTYFWKGDTVTVKWANIDSKTYDFFFTLENDGGDGPFSTPVKIKTNVSNGLGIWAGYGAKYYTLIIPN